MAEVAIGLYRYKDLNPDQKYLAIQRRAEEISRQRMAGGAQLGDWIWAAAEVATRDNPLPTDEQIQPVAYQNSIDRRNCLPERTHRMAMDMDWKAAELEMRKFGEAFLPVALVPQLEPQSHTCYGSKIRLVSYQAA